MERGGGSCMIGYALGLMANSKSQKRKECSPPFSLSRIVYLMLVAAKDGREEERWKH